MNFLERASKAAAVALARAEEALEHADALVTTELAQQQQRQQQQQELDGDGPGGMARKGEAWQTK
jgi:hypothetical protein